LNDIFISYAHIDNEALTEEDKGWISKFPICASYPIVDFIEAKKI